MKSVEMLLVRLKRAVLLGMVLLLVALMPPARAATVTLDFDSLPTAGGSLTGTAVTDYLAGFGITASNLTEGAVLGVVDLSNAGFVVPPSSPNVFTLSGPTPFGHTFTLNFDPPVDNFSLTRAGYVGALSPSGNILGDWSAVAFDGTGRNLGTIGEPLISSFGDIPAQTFTISARGISSIVFTADAHGFAGQQMPYMDNISFSASCGTKPKKRGTGLFVNCHELSADEAEWVRYIGANVVSALPSDDPEERLKIAAAVTWWALSEGVYLGGEQAKGAIAPSYSHCIRLQGNQRKEVTLGPTDTCQPIGTQLIWQVGLAAVQVIDSTRFNDLQSELDRASIIVASILETETSILSQAAALAGYGGTPTGDTIVNSTGSFKLSWLKRHPVVGFVFEYFVVSDLCLGPDGLASNGCVSGKNDQKKFYANSPAAIDQSIADLKAIFRRLAPAP
jgi:hypothetical protein